MHLLKRNSEGDSEYDPVKEAKKKEIKFTQDPDMLKKLNIRKPFGGRIRI